MTYKIDVKHLYPPLILNVMVAMDIILSCMLQRGNLNIDRYTYFDMIGVKSEVSSSSWQL